MRSISIRQFQQHFHAELASPPFIVTRRGKVAFVVTTSLEVVSDVTTSKEPTFVNTPEEVLKAVHITELPFSKEEQLR